MTEGFEREREILFNSELYCIAEYILQYNIIQQDTFSKQERALWVKDHPGEQCNGFRPRRWRGAGCSFELRIFLARVRATCEDIGSVCERIYGHHYSKQQVSFFSRTSKDEIYKWLSRQLSPR